MRRIFVLAACAVVCAATCMENAAAQVPDSLMAKYRRSSLYTMFIAHPDQTFGGEIQAAFMEMGTPDKFDDHSIGAEFKTIVSTTGSKRKRKNTEVNLPDIESHIDDNKIGNRLVAKWFNRDADGAFDMALISERGHYDATMSDVALADMSARGRGMLADAGEELIHKTFVMVNDITYIDKSERTKTAGSLLRIAGTLAGAVMNNPDMEKLGSNVADVTEKFGGFSVRITSYLFRLDWNPETAATFYQDMWVDGAGAGSGAGGGERAARVAAFDQSDIFRLEYIGSHTSSAGNVTVQGWTEATDGALISKVCTRALDRSVVELQRTYDAFKVTTPIHSIDKNGDIFVQIGLKEGINEKSSFEVLEQRETEEGRTEYRRVGVIEPVKGEIWDNRFMAAEEAAQMAAAGVANTDAEAAAGNVNLTATRFKKTSGGGLYPGLLVKEMTIK